MALRYWVTLCRKKLQTAACVACWIAPFVCHAEWISSIEKKYAQRNPELYQQTMRAKSMNREGYGNTDSELQAKKLLLDVVRQNSKFAPAYVQLASVTAALGYISDNEYEPAALHDQEEYVKKALALAPDYDEALALMGFSKMMQGNLTEAESYYMRLENMGSGYPYLKAQMSELEVKRENYAKAVAIAEKGYEEQKSDSKLAVDYVTQILIAYDDFPGNHLEEMEKWQAKRTDLSPNVAWFWGDHARFRLYYMFDYEGAITYGTKALSLMRYGMGERYLAAAYYLKWASLKDKASTKEVAE
jgi:tetratricopeptide (TPR) repeat protein